MAAVIKKREGVLLCGVAAVENRDFGESLNVENYF